MCHSCNNPPCCNPRHVTPDTHAANMDWKTKCGRDNHPHGDSLAVKLTSKLVARLRQDYKTGRYSFRTLGNQYGISKTHARHVAQNVKWKSVATP